MGMIRYQVSLLHLRRSARDFVEAFVDASRAAQELDPEGKAPPDPVAAEAFGEVAALLAQAARIPGAREVFLAALNRKES